MTYNTVHLFASLDIMWKGMLGLFVVCGFIMLLIIGISRFMMPKKKKDKQIG